jgi:hypothetical protein
MIISDVWEPQVTVPRVQSQSSQSWSGQLAKKLSAHRLNASLLSFVHEMPESHADAVGARANVVVNSADPAIRADARTDPAAQKRLIASISSRENWLSPNKFVAKVDLSL